MAKWFKSLQQGGEMDKRHNFQMRTDDRFLEKLDEWRRLQPDLPSRAEAIRRLVDRGLAFDAARDCVLAYGDVLARALINDRLHTDDLRSGLELFEDMEAAAARLSSEESRTLYGQVRSTFITLLNKLPSRETDE